MQLVIILQLFIVQLIYGPTVEQIPTKLSYLPLYIVVLSAQPIIPQALIQMWRVWREPQSSRLILRQNRKQSNGHELVSLIFKLHIRSYHSKQLNPLSTLLDSCVVIYSQLSICPGEMEPFKDYLSTCGHLTNSSGWMTFKTSICLNCCQLMFTAIM